MSTKIFTGFWVPKLGTRAALELLGAQRPALQALVDAKHRRIIASRIVNLVDSYTVARHTGLTLSPRMQAWSRDSAWWTCTTELAEEQTKCRHGLRREPHIDCDLQLSLFVARTGRLLGIVQEERLGAREHLLATAGFADLSYWNNSDRPDEVPARQWGQRARTWADALDNPLTPRFCTQWEPGLAFPEDVRLLLASLPERIEQAARNYVLRKHLGDSEQSTRKTALQGLLEAATLLKEPSSELGKAQAAACREFASVLLPDLSAHLFTPLVELPLPAGTAWA